MATYMWIVAVLLRICQCLSLIQAIHVCDYVDCDSDNLDVYDMSGVLYGQGTLPVDFFSGINQALVIDLSDNALNQLPEGLFNETIVYELYLQNNSIKSIPLDWCEQSALSVMYLQNNNITTIPSCFFESSSFAVLVLDSNSMFKIETIRPNVNDDTIGMMNQLSLANTASTVLPEWLEYVLLNDSDTVLDIRNTTVSSIPSNLHDLTIQFKVDGTVLNRCPPGTSSETGEKPCTICPLNTYSNSSGASSCVQCRLGMGTIGKGSTECIELCSRSDDNNTLLSHESLVSCASCPPTFVRNVVSNSCVCPEYTMDVNGTCTVVSCPENTYSSTGLGPNCKECPSLFTAKSGAIECICKDNLVMNEDGTKCLCPMGYFGTSNNCMKCAPNQFTNISGASECNQCPNGYGTGDIDGSTKCLPQCAKGSSRIGGGVQKDESTLCDLCAPGTAQPLSGANECDLCPIGEYQPNRGMTSCIKCPVPSFTRSVGSTSESNCSCLNGLVRSMSGECISCPMHSSAPIGAFDITECECVNGYYKSDSTCMACGVNQTTFTTGATSKDQCVCAKNYYLSSLGTCQKCPSSNPFSASGSTSIQACRKDCPFGTIGDLNGNCYCPAGTYPSGHSEIPCKECEIGFWKDTIADTNCIPCPIGFATIRTGTTSETGCTSSSIQYLPSISTSVLMLSVLHFVLSIYS